MKINNLQGTDFEKGYGQIGKMFFFMHSELDARSKLVYCFLSTFGEVAYPSRKTIAQACSINLKTVDKCLKSLIQSGVIIKCDYQRGKKGQYKSVPYVICHKLSDIEKNKKSRLNASYSYGVPSDGAPLGGTPSSDTVIVDINEKLQDRKRQNGEKVPSQDVLQDIIDSVGGN